VPARAATKRRLFAAELFRMYTKFAERQGWRLDLMSSNETGVGGLKEVIALVEGRRVYSRLKYESGVHRVQRVPATEASGTHPHVNRYRGGAARGGRGGRPDRRQGSPHRHLLLERAGRPERQHHLLGRAGDPPAHRPGGEQQDEKSQIKNRAKAMKVLRSRLYEMEMQQQQEAIAKDRRSQVGTGERSEKIRTYNFPQNRITDHRVNFTTHQLTAVLPAVLIPRPETELIVEESLAWRAARPHGAPRVLDIGTGSGCLAITLALEWPDAEMTATDISATALAVAHANAVELGARVTFLEASGAGEDAGPIDLLVSNPPYIPRDQYAGLQAEVRDHEPVSALVGGDDGLVVVREVVSAAARRLAPGGLLLVEFGYGQADAVREIVENADGLRLLRIRDDLQAIPRVVVATAAA
jgi:release factor-specific protein-(glutamine-N5) methyltransferase